MSSNMRRSWRMSWVRVQASRAAARAWITRSARLGTSPSPRWSGDRKARDGVVGDGEQVDSGITCGAVGADVDAHVVGAGREGRREDRKGGGGGESGDLGGRRGI